MSAQLHDPGSMDLTSSERSLLLVWQNPRSRRFSKVGRLDALPGGQFAFQYLPEAHEDEDFHALLEYPDLGQAYVTIGLPSFFANRVLSRHRSSFARYITWLGLASFSERETPMEFLARTGGSRATGTFHVVDVPYHAHDRFTSRFFVSGLRHSEDIQAILPRLTDGDDLNLALEPGNRANPHAVLVLTAGDEKIGYVPDWMCSDVHALIDDQWEVSASVERVNLDAPSHVRLLVRLDARPV